MQKIVGAVLILMASGGIGVAKGLDIQNYLKELEQLKQVFWILRREIQYTKTQMCIRDSIRIRLEWIRFRVRKFYG